MWSKLTSSFKASRSGIEDEQNQPPTRPVTPATPAPSSSLNVMNGVYEVHPNLSVFQPGPESPLPPTEAPSSPKRKNPFKRLSKLPLVTTGSAPNDENEPKSPFGISLSIPKRIKSNLNLNSGSVRGSQDTLNRPSTDSLGQYPSLPPTPLTPDVPYDKGSIRSILKDKNAPGTGRSVRFFSKDAFKTISPDPSSGEMEMSTAEAQLFSTDKKRGYEPPRIRSPPRSVMDVFPSVVSTPSSFEAAVGLSLNMGTPTGDLPDFFADASMDREMPPAIPAAPSLGSDAFELQESVYEHPEEDDTAHGSRPRAASVEPFAAPSTIAPSAPPKTHDRSQSFSFGQTLFHSLSMGRTPSTSSDPVPAAGNAPNAFGGQARTPVFRPRAKSETMSAALNRAYTPSETGSADSSGRGQVVAQYLSALGPGSPGAAPEADISDVSASSLLVFGQAHDGQSLVHDTNPDPFAADAGTYYAVTPPAAKDEKSQYFPGALNFSALGFGGRKTPSLASSITGSLAGDSSMASHSRASSREDAMIVALREQLALHEQAQKQLSLDLAAKDELVGALQERLADASAEASERRTAARAWRKKVSELERACRSLEAQADRSAQDAMERSVLEEASGEALRLMHRRMEALEAQRKEADRSASELKKELEGRKEQERLLKAGIEDAQAQIEMITGIANADDSFGPGGAERWNTVRQSWSAEKAGLAEQLQKAEQAKEALQNDMEKMRRTMKQCEEGERRAQEEVKVLRAEVEAQWANTEKGGEALSALRQAREDAEKERDELRQTLQDTQKRISDLEAEVQDADAKRVEMEGQLNEAFEAKEDLEREHDEYDEQMRADQAHIEELTTALQDREDRISELTQEAQYARDSIARLEDNLRKRDADASEYTSRLMAAETAAEEAQSALSTAQREAQRAAEHFARELAEARAEAQRAQADMQNALARQATGDVNGRMLEERQSALEAEAERLRRQVHELQQASADKDMKITQLNKQRAQDKDDMNSMNIALDSKQQELELIKRKLAVRGTGGATPAPAKIATHGRQSWIPPVSLNSRPPSAMSDVSDAVSTAASTTESVTPPMNKTSSGVGSTTKHARKSSTPLSASISARRVPGSMGPPSSSAKATPIRTAGSSALSSSTTSTARKLAFTKPPPSTLNKSVSRRPSGSGGPSNSMSSSRVTSPVSSSGNGSEKENATPRVRKIESQAVPA